MLLLLAVGLVAQFRPGGSVTRVSEAPDDLGYQVLPKADSATVTYYCWGPSRRQGSALSLTVTTTTNANPGAMTITSHGFNQYATPIVLISGATGNWTPINGLHILTYVDANTMSIDVDTSSFGAWGSQSIAMTTYAVRETDTLWAIKKIVTSGGATVFSGWASGAANANETSRLPGGRPEMGLACASRASYGYQ